MSLQHSERRILQDFIVIWLDQDINEYDADIQSSITQLRKIVNSIKTFVQVDECIDYLSNIVNEKAFMIVSNSFDQQLVPLIKDISQLFAIYVLCSGTKTYKQWTEEHHKVKGIFCQIETLCDKLQRDVHQADINLTPISIVSPSNVTALNQLDQSFMYSQLLTETLLKLEYDAKAKTEFVEYCLIQHVENESALRVIDEFDQQYNQSLPIWWYTRETFIYSMLNKSLRTQDTETIIKMGFFIQDLHRQIHRLCESSNNRNSFIVYRGQGMFVAEFKKMRENQGGLLSFNNFLSTSVDREVSFMYADSIQSNLEMIGVLFLMEIDPLISRSPFTSLDNISYFSDSEKEILFSMHTVFRIGDMRQIDKRLWEVKLTLTNDNDEQLQRLTDFMREEIGRQPTWNNLGLLMFKMGEYNKAEEIYKAILNSLPVDDLTYHAHIHNQLGVTMSANGYHSAASSHYERALDILQKVLLPYNPTLATLHANIGLLHRMMGKYSTALLHLEKALEIGEKNFSADDPSLDSVHENIGLVCYSIGDYSAALSHHEKALKIRQKYLPPNHPSLAVIHNNIGLAHKSLGNYPTALLYLEKTLEIWQKTLPPNHPDQAALHNNIGLVYNSMGKYSIALSHHEKMLEISQKSLHPNHPDLATAHNNVGLTHGSMRNHSAALSHYEKALEIRQKSLSADHPGIAMTHNNIGMLCGLMGAHSKSLSHQEKALAIRLKALPSNHPDLLMSHNNIGCLHLLKGEHSTALVHLNKALEITKKSLSSNHPDFAKLHSNIACALQGLGRYEEAMQHVFEAIDNATCNFGPADPQVQMLQRQLKMFLHKNIDN